MGKRPGDKGEGMLCFVAMAGSLPKTLAKNWGGAAMFLYVFMYICMHVYTKIAKDIVFDILDLLSILTS